MDLHNKKFTVRYQGVDYGPGTVIYGVDDALAEQLISDSNGAIEALPEKEAPKKQKKASPNSNSEDANEQTGTGLPEVNPQNTVK